MRVNGERNRAMVNGFLLLVLEYDPFFVENVKPLAYADKPETIAAVEEYFRRVIADIRPELLQKVVQN